MCLNSSMILSVSVCPWSAMCLQRRAVRECSRFLYDPMANEARARYEGTDEALADLLTPFATSPGWFFFAESATNPLDVNALLRHGNLFVT